MPLCEGRILFQIKDTSLSDLLYVVKIRPVLIICNLFRMTPSLARPSSTGVILVKGELYWHKRNVCSLTRFLNNFSIDIISTYIFLVTFLGCSKKHQPSRDHRRGYRGSWAETHNRDGFADRRLKEGVGGFVDACRFLRLVEFVFLSHSFNLLTEILFLNMYHSHIFTFPWIGSKLNTASSTLQFTQFDAESPVVWVHVLWCLTPAPLELYGERNSYGRSDQYQDQPGP